MLHPFKVNVSFYFSESQYFLPPPTYPSSSHTHTNTHIVFSFLRSVQFRNVFIFYVDIFQFLVLIYHYLPLLVNSKNFNFSFQIENKDIFTVIRNI